MTKASLVPSSAAERMRRCRERRRKGSCIVRLELSLTIVESLVSRGYLDDLDRSGRVFIAAAALAFIEDALAANYETPVGELRLS